MDAVLDQYMNYMICIASKFLLGLCSSRPRTFVDPTILPMLTPVMLDYIITQVFPLKVLYLEGQITPTYADVVKQENIDKMMVKFNAIHNKFMNIKAASSASFITDQVAQNLLKIQDILKHYLQADSSLKTTEDFSRALRQLASHHNNLNISTSFKTESTNRLVSLIVWLLTAFTDWFGVKVIEVADVVAVASMFEIGVEGVVDSDLFLQDMFMVTEANPQLQTKLFDILFANELLIAEPALVTLTQLVDGLMRPHNTKLVQKILKLGGYISE